LPSLIAGNTVVFKSSEKSLAVSQWLSRVFLESGLGEGMVNVLYGKGSTVGDELVRHTGISAVLIDGRSSTIRSVSQNAVANREIPVWSPSTGESLVAILDDANLDIAVNIALTSAFRASGQLRSSARRIVVAESLVEAFSDRLRTAVLNLSVGDGMKHDSMIGPLINCDAVERYLEVCQSIDEEHQVILLKGDRLTGAIYDKGCFVSPTVLRANLSDLGSRLDTEPVGPIACIESFDTVERAVSMINASPSVQTLSIVTEGTTGWRYIRDRAKYTAGYVNHPTTLTACWDVDLALDRVTSHAVFVLGARCNDQASVSKTTLPS
jgi:aldehyde dehydrogenase (NAD+)